MQAAIRLRAKDNCFDGQTLEAAVCTTCGAKIYPARLLKVHQRHHRLLRRYFKTELKQLQESIKELRAL
jgi:hypothetical protein